MLNQVENISWCRCRQDRDRCYASPSSPWCWSGGFSVTSSLLLCITHVLFLVLVHVALFSCRWHDPCLDLDISDLLHLDCPHRSLDALQTLLFFSLTFSLFLDMILLLILICTLRQDNIIWIVPNDPWMQNRDKLQVRNIDCDRKIINLTGT